MNSFIPWVGGKGRLLWLINKLAPYDYERFIDVFGGSGTVLLSRPHLKNCLEIYNDYNSNLTNLVFCVKERTISLIMELGFLQLNSRDDFEVLYKFFSREEFTDEYLEEEMELTEVVLEPLGAQTIRMLMSERSQRGDVHRAADFFKLIRYSFSGTAKSFGAKSCDLRSFFHLIWECSRRLAGVVIENRDFEAVIRQYDREKAFIYCDPPYYEAEQHYEVVFTKLDHTRLRDVLKECKGYVMVSYNYCKEVLELYEDFYIVRTNRANNLSQKKGSVYEEVIITNYDPAMFGEQVMMSMGGTGYEIINTPKSKENKGEQNEARNLAPCYR